MKIWKIKKSELLNILKSNGMFYYHKYKYSHDKARKIMKQFVKDGIASYMKSSNKDMVYIKLLKQDSMTRVQSE